MWTKTIDSTCLHGPTLPDGPLDLGIIRCNRICTTARVIVESPVGDRIQINKVFFEERHRELTLQEQVLLDLVGISDDITIKNRSEFGLNLSPRTMNGGWKKLNNPGKSKEWPYPTFSKTNI